MRVNKKIHDLLIQIDNILNKKDIILALCENDNDMVKEIELLKTYSNSLKYSTISNDYKNKNLNVFDLKLFMNSVFKKIFSINIFDVENEFNKLDDNIKNEYLNTYKVYNDIVNKIKEMPNYYMIENELNCNNVLLEFERENNKIGYTSLICSIIILVIMFISLFGRDYYTKQSLIDNYNNSKENIDIKLDEYKNNSDNYLNYSTFNYNLNKIVVYGPNNRRERYTYKYFVNFNIDKNNSSKDIDSSLMKDEIEYILKDSLSYYEADGYIEQDSVNISKTFYDEFYYKPIFEYDGNNIKRVGFSYLERNLLFMFPLVFVILFGFITIIQVSLYKSKEN